MAPLTILGRVPIPAEISANVPGVLATWPRHRREVWEVHQRRPKDAKDTYPGHFLELPAVSFLEETLRHFGLREWAQYQHSLVVFGNVGLHPDEGTQCHGRAGSIFHLVLEGEGIFHLPGVRDKSLRRLKLEKGLAFIFNPNVRHAITDACPGNIATLSAVVPRNFAAVPTDDIGQP
jgi:hypothetical protein